MGAVLIGDDVASELALTKPHFSSRSGHDRATIGPRSDVDRGTGDSLIAV